MFQQEASAHDKPILNNLREDFLKQWKEVEELFDVSEKNHRMKQIIETMVKTCNTAAGLVQDKTSGALIYNILLILSAIVTIGLSLVIYALCTKQSRAERGSFFFHDKELSKTKIEAVKTHLEEIDRGISLGA